MPPTLTAIERQILVRALDKWDDGSSVWVVDHYLAQAVERIIEGRTAHAGDPLANS